MRIAAAGVHAGDATQIKFSVSWRGDGPSYLVDESSFMFVSGGDTDPDPNRFNALRDQVDPLSRQFHPHRGGNLVLLAVTQFQGHAEDGNRGSHN